MRKATGFTLMEILIAMAVFLIGVVAIIAVFPRGLRSSQASQDDSICATFIESLADAVTDAVHRQDQDADPATAGFQIRVFHDGLDPNEGAFLRLPEAWDDDGVVDAGADPNIPNDDSPKIPDYLDPAKNPQTVAWLAPPADPLADNQQETATQEQVMDNRGWWFPNGDQPAPMDGAGAVTANPLDPAGRIFFDNAVGAAPDGGVADWVQNSGCAVFRLGTMTVAGIGGGSTADAALGGQSGMGAAGSAGLAREYVDPLKKYYFNVKVEVDNRFTPMTSPNPRDGGEVAAANAGTDARLEAYDLDDPGDGIAASDFRRAYFPGLYRFSVFIYRDWNPSKTRNYAERERQKLHVFQFLAAGTQAGW